MPPNPQRRVHALLGGVLEMNIFELAQDYIAIHIWNFITRRNESTNPLSGEGIYQLQRDTQTNLFE